MSNDVLLLDVPAVAIRLSVSERFIKEQIRRGTLRSVKLGSRRLVHIADLEAFAERLRGEVL